MDGGWTGGVALIKFPGGSGYAGCPARGNIFSRFFIVFPACVFTRILSTFVTPLGSHFRIFSMFSGIRFGTWILYMFLEGDGMHFGAIFG